MSETWYRGEGVGVKPTTPGSTSDHDLADGMYLADTKDSATKYAQLRASDPKAQRVFSVVISRASLRVLDLTTDPRWQKDLKIVEPYIRQANENYGRVFKDFVKHNKIDLNQFDAVVGVDYLRGGRQMVILSRNGQPTLLHVTIRNAFKLLGTALTGLPASSAIKGGMRGMIGHGLQFVGGAAAMLGLSLLGNWLRAKVEASLIEKQMKDLEPKIAAGIAERFGAIAALQAEGNRAFAIVTVQSSRREVQSGGYGTIDTFAVLTLFFVDIGPKQVTTKNTDTHFHLGNTETVTRYTYSFEVTLSFDEMLIFKVLMIEYKFYENLLKHAPNNIVYSAELARVRQRIIEAFGPAAARDVLDAWMWPKFHYVSKKA